VTLNIPYPPDYGGMIDCFHRIRMLSKKGVNIHLHAFEYGREHSKELESICKIVNYYRRDTSSKRHFSLLPYSVVSRSSDELLRNLLKNDYPVLFDGIQTTILLNNPALAGRTKVVRIHNIEPVYYRSLARYERNFLRKMYYLIEGAKLSRYESILSGADYLATLSITDHEYYNRKFKNSVLIPTSHQFDNIVCKPGSGDFILYHADLSVNENEAVAGFLISKVFSRLSVNCIIAGRKPSLRISTQISHHPNIELISDPANETMEELIMNAHINVIPSMASNGFKLKLLLSLYCGRHCIVNNATVNGSGLYCLCHIADYGEKMVSKINQLMGKPFTEEMIEERRTILSKNYNNLLNANRLMNLLFSE